ncbi:hypothetical protein Holit_00439 [Hollandina sp. SP2]
MYFGAILDYMKKNQPLIEIDNFCSVKKYY